MSSGKDDNAPPRWRGGWRGRPARGRWWVPVASLVLALLAESLSASALQAAVQAERQAGAAAYALVVQRAWRDTLAPAAEPMAAALLARADEVRQAEWRHGGKLTVSANQAAVSSLQSLAAERSRGPGPARQDPDTVQARSALAALHRQVLAAAGDAPGDPALRPLMRLLGLHHPALLQGLAEPVGPAPAALALAREGLAAELLAWQAVAAGRDAAGAALLGTHRALQASAQRLESVAEPGLQRDQLVLEVLGAAQAAGDAAATAAQAQARQWADDARQRRAAWRWLALAALAVAVLAGAWSGVSWWRHRQPGLWPPGGPG